MKERLDMRTDASVPQKKENLLRQVVEGKNPCPTILDLDHLVRRALEKADLALVSNQHELWVEAHLPSCERCQQVYHGLVTLAKASRKALDQVTLIG